MSYADIVAQAYNDALTKTAADSTQTPTPAPKDGGEGFIKKTFKAPGRGLRNATSGAANAALAGDAGAMAHIKKGLAKGLQGHYAPHVAALGGIAAGLGAAGYGTKKYLEHQNNKMKYASEGEENMYIPYMDKSAAFGFGGLMSLGSGNKKTPAATSKPNDFQGALDYSNKKAQEKAALAGALSGESSGKKNIDISRSGKKTQKKGVGMFGAPGRAVQRMGLALDRSTNQAVDGSDTVTRGKGAINKAKRGVGAVLRNKYVAHGALPTALAAAGAGGAYLYNRNKKTKAAADSQVAKVAEEEASMIDRFKKGYSEYSGANKIMRGGDSLQKNNPKGGNYWSGAKRQLGRAMSNKYVAHGALPTALGAAGLGSAYAYNQYKKKNKSASLEAEIFNQTLLDINTETAFLEELAEWKEANFDFGY